VRLSFLIALALQLPAAAAAASLPPPVTWAGSATLAAPLDDAAPNPASDTAPALADADADDEDLAAAAVPSLPARRLITTAAVAPRPTGPPEGAASSLFRPPRLLRA